MTVPHLLREAFLFSLIAFVVAAQIIRTMSPSMTNALPPVVLRSFDNATRITATRPSDRRAKGGPCVRTARRWSNFICDCTNVMRRDHVFYALRENRGVYRKTNKKHKCDALFLLYIMPYSKIQQLSLFGVL